MRRAWLLLLLVASRAGAWDSRCYLAAPVPDPAVRGGLRAECAPGPETARNRWIGPSDEHRALLEFGRIFAHLPRAVSEDVTLEVFTGDGTLEVSGQSTGSLQPEGFATAKRVQDRTITVQELAQLPDHAYALWDWALGNETCPIDPALAAPDCHDFARHMGAVNSNHFVPQAAFFYEYYHRLALEPGRRLRAHDGAAARSVGRRLPRLPDRLRARGADAGGDRPALPPGRVGRRGTCGSAGARPTPPTSRRSPTRSSSR